MVAAVAANANSHEVSTEMRMKNYTYVVHLTNAVEYHFNTKTFDFVYSSSYTKILS